VFRSIVIFFSLFITIYLKSEQTRRTTKLKFYETMAILSLLYGRECWMLGPKDESNIHSGEMKFLPAVKERI
jgi:hypothetical protein